jgi:hypothetical protein
MFLFFRKVWKVVKMPSTTAEVSCICHIMCSCPIKDETQGEQTSHGPCSFPQRIFSKISRPFPYRVCGKWNIPFQVWLIPKACLHASRKYYNQGKSMQFLVWNYNIHNYLKDWTYVYSISGYRPVRLSTHKFSGSWEHTVDCTELWQFEGEMKDQKYVMVLVIRFTTPTM